MLLDEFTIHSFRGLRDLTLKDLGRVNLLVGPNNSGKTSVLEAIELFRDPINKSTWLDAAFRRQPVRSGFNFQDLLWLFPQPSSSEKLAKTDGTQIKISALGSASTKNVTALIKELKGKPNSMLEEQKSGDPNLKKLYNPYSPTVQAGAELTLSRDEENFSEKKIFMFWEMEPFSYLDPGHVPLIPGSYIYPLYHWGESAIYEIYGDLVKLNLKPELSEMLKVFDSDIEDIEGIPDSTTGYFLVKHKRLGHVPITAFGDGIRRVFNYLVSSVLAHRGLLLIDEIENSIHTSALKELFTHLLELAKRFDIQLFATTHSLEAVDAIVSAGLSDPKSLTVYRLTPINERRPLVRYEGGELFEMRHELGLDVR